MSRGTWFRPGPRGPANPQYNHSHSVAAVLAEIARTTADDGWSTHTIRSLARALDWPVTTTQLRVAAGVSAGQIIRERIAGRCVIMRLSDGAAIECASAEERRAAVTAAKSAAMKAYWAQRRSAPAIPDPIRATPDPPAATPAPPHVSLSSFLDW